MAESMALDQLDMQCTLAVRQIRRECFARTCEVWGIIPTEANFERYNQYCDNHKENPDEDDPGTQLVRSQHGGQSPQVD